MSISMVICSMGKGIVMVCMLSCAILLVECKARRRQPVPVHATGKDGYASADNLLVSYADETAKARVLKAARRYGATVLYAYNIIPMVAIRKPADKSLAETAEYFRNVKGVTRVSRDMIMKIDDPKPVLERMPESTDKQEGE